MKSVRLLPVVGLSCLISQCIASDFAVSHMFDVVRCYLLQSCFYIAEDFIQPTHSILYCGGVFHIGRRFTGHPCQDTDCVSTDCMHILHHVVISVNHFVNSLSFKLLRVRGLPDNG